MPWPSAIRDVDQLDDLLSDPSSQAVEALRTVPGDILVLGVGGKMGPTLARMAVRASGAAGVTRRVIGVSRFSSTEVAPALERSGVEAIACDLLDERALARLPDVPNVIFMAGRKFGSTGDEPYTWAMNTHLPALICQRYASSRIVAFSTGNVYGLAPVGGGGSSESDPPAPVGEYAMSCLGRERIFEHFSRARGTPVVLLRLNYATEMRYGVLADLAARVFRRETIDVTMGAFNVIWQADANAMALTALAHAAAPAVVVNVAGAEELSVRTTCTTLARLLGVEVEFAGHEAPDAVLSDGALGRRLLGAPRVEVAQLLAWTAEWTARGGETLGRATHFESRGGRF